MPSSALPFTSEVIRSFGPAKDLKSHAPGSLITSVDIDDSGLWCVTAGSDESIQLYDLKSGRHEKSVFSKKYGAHLAKFTHSSTNCVYASTKEDDTVRYLSLHDNQFIRYFRGHRNKVTGIEISPIDDTMITTALDRSLRLWDLRSPNAHGILNVPTPTLTAFDATGLVFAVASSEIRTIVVYDVRKFDKEPFLTFRSDAEGSWLKLEFSNDGKLIVLATDKHSHEIYDAFTGKHMISLTGYKPIQRAFPSVSPVAFSMDGRYLFGGSNDNTVAIWDLQSITQGDAPLAPTETIEALQQPSIITFSSKLMLMASADTSLTLWVPDSQKL